MKTITEDDFWGKYKPQLNHFYNDEEAVGWNGCMYETFGEELEYIQDMARISPDRVWTIIEGDEGLCITSGYHWVNRQGYLVTEIPADDDVIDVEIEDISDYDEELEYLNENEEE